ncbi:MULTISPECIES: hypothetical protein, partial [unclassified Halomonas]|uniref:hypothetical protein n=1 Tax=unclassified Halomonas TaxID=2609666 RepID=UPI0020A08A23
PKVFTFFTAGDAGRPRQRMRTLRIRRRECKGFFELFSTLGERLIILRNRYSRELSAKDKLPTIDHFHRAGTP